MTLLADRADAAIAAALQLLEATERAWGACPAPVAAHLLYLALSTGHTCSCCRGNCATRLAATRANGVTSSVMAPLASDHCRLFDAAVQRDYDMLATSFRRVSARVADEAAPTRRRAIVEWGALFSMLLVGADTPSRSAATAHNGNAAEPPPTAAQLDCAAAVAQRMYATFTPQVTTQRNGNRHADQLVLSEGPAVLDASARAALRCIAFGELPQSGATLYIDGCELLSDVAAKTATSPECTLTVKRGQATFGWRPRSSPQAWHTSSYSDDSVCEVHLAGDEEHSDFIAADDRPSSAESTPRRRGSHSTSTDVDPVFECTMNWKPLALLQPRSFQSQPVAVWLGAQDAGGACAAALVAVTPHVVFAFRRSD